MKRYTLKICTLIFSFLITLYLLPNSIQASAEVRTYQLETQSKAACYEEKGKRCYVPLENKEDYYHTDYHADGVIWQEDVPYDFYADYHYYTASGGVTMTIDDDGNFEITYNDPKAYLPWTEKVEKIEYESFSVTGQFKEESGNGGYHGGWCYIDEDTGDQYEYVCEEANFSTDRCNLISDPPNEYNWSMDLSKSLASVSILIEDDGQVSLDIPLEIFTFNRRHRNFGESYLFTVVGEKVDNNSTNQNIDTSAAESEGEDGGVVIDDEIVEGKTKEKDDEIVEGRTKEKDDNDNDSKAGAAGEAAGGAALVGAAAAGATALDDKKKKKEKGKSTYKMHIYKDFGDSIKKGAPIEGVFARIVEVKASGQQIERPDLTAGIRLYSGTRGLSVKQVGMMSGYMGAEVSIPNENEQIETAVVCAAYTGAGGSFTQYIHFRAICPRPYISMPDNPTPGYPSIAMLFGDGGTYEQVFILHDFEKPASSISIECDDTRLSIRYETVDAASQTYKLIIQNRSAGDVTPIGSFPIKQGIHITAKNDREFAEEYMLAEFYPEGISVEIDDRLIEDGYYSFYTCKGPSVDYNSPQLAPTLFKVKAAYKDSSGKIVVTTDGIDVAERLTAEDDVSKNVEAKFRYEIKKYQGGAYRFEPGAVVPTTEKDSFIYKLDMRFDSGAHYEYSLPVRLIGEVITQDRLKREDEKRKLKRAIEIVGLTANSYVQQLVREWDQTPTNMLYLIRREVLNEGREFYIRETEYWLDVADKMDKQIVFWSGVRWAVNMAFSIVTRAHFGLACGDYAEAIATPLFDVIIDFVGERMSDKAWKAEPKPIDMTTAIAVVLRMAENYSWATITDGFSLGEQSKAVARVGGLIAAAMGMNFLRAYFFRSSGETYGDFYKSLRQALMDTSINTIKGLFIYGLVGNVYRNADRLRPVFERFIGNHFDVTGQIDRLMNRVCGVAADTLHTSGTAKGVADRLAEGVAYTLGDGVNKVIEWISAYDPEAAQKKQATMQVTGSDGRTAELSYFAILSELVKYICSQLGLDTMFSEERVRAQVNQNLPEEQPYLTQDEIKEGLDQYGIKPV